MAATSENLSALSAYGTARATVSGTPLGEDELRRTQAFWRACNYLALGMIYLRDNPLLREPRSADDIAEFPVEPPWMAYPGNDPCRVLGFLARSQTQCANTAGGFPAETPGLGTAPTGFTKCIKLPLIDLLTSR